VLLGQEPAQPPQVVQLAATLASDATVFDKARACEQLARAGDARAVPALAKLLDDEQLACYARCALEGIPDAAAGAALREAAGQLDGEMLIGVLGSIGTRRDEAAIDVVVPLLDGDDAKVAAAAARTLGQIGTPRTAELLQQSLAKAEPDRRPALGNACLICAERLAAEGEPKTAIVLCDALQRTDLPDHVHRAAIYRTILIQGKNGAALIGKLVESDDDARFRLALQAARQLEAKTAVSRQLIPRFSAQSSQRKALLLIVLGELGDEAALPLVAEAARAGETEVRVEALRALATLGDASVVAVLLGAAAESDERIATAARSTLAVLESDEINAAIVELLDADDPKTRQMAVDMAAGRRITSATPALLKLAGASEAFIRQAAIRALGATVQIADLPEFIDVAADTIGSDDFSTAETALKAACLRMPQEACAQRLTAAASEATVVEQVFLLEQLTAVGGTTALKTVAAAARTDDDALQDAATRLLGQWATADAAPALLDLARTLTSEKYRVRAVRGYVRVARQLDMTAAERLAVCRNTLAIAGRNADKVLVFEVLRRYPTPEGLALAVSLLDDEELRQPACVAIVGMAAGVVVRAPEATEKALHGVLDLTDDPALRQEIQRELARAHELAEQRREESEFTPLFDGVGLDGWEGGQGVFRVADGAIVGGDANRAIGRGNDFICTQKQYGDFELRLQFKLTGANVNGGVNLRSKRDPQSGVAAGYQADLGAGWWGCLYDEARRNRVLAASVVEPREKPLRAGEFNDYRIRCEGRQIQLWINGVQTVDYTEQDASIPVREIIALQVQANRPGEAAYRNLRIRELGGGGGG